MSGDPINRRHAIGFRNLPKFVIQRIRDFEHLAHACPRFLFQGCYNFSTPGWSVAPVDSRKKRGLYGRRSMEGETERFPFAEFPL
jgi:hypothetical protein